MSVDTRHPLYAERYEDWTKMRDTYAGDRKVKSKGVTYLPATGGQIADGMSTGQPGLDTYNRYKDRSLVPSFVKDAIEAMVGIMHRKPARIEVPAKMQPLLENCTGKGESAWTVLRRINEWQLREGRLGLLAETPDNRPVNEALPFVVMYDAFSVINWDNGVFENGTRAVELVVLDESEYERQQDFSWEFVTKYRVLIMSEQAQNINDGSNTGQVPPAGGVYSTAQFRDGEIDFNIETVVQPQVGGKTLEFIPFVFVNTNDLVPEPDEPPLLGLADLVLAIYKLEADYRQNMHMIAAATTFVVTGGELKPGTRVGPGAKIELPKGATAEFVGVDDKGLESMRTALEDDRKRAGDQTSKLFDDTTTFQSGKALNVRMAAKTATLNQIAQTGAEALQQVLRHIAVWMGLDPMQVIVEANLDFEDDEVQGQNMLQLMQAVQMGLPLSPESIHRWLAKHDLTDKEFEEEMRLVEEWRDSILGGTGMQDDQSQNDNSTGEVTNTDGNNQ